MTNTGFNLLNPNWAEQIVSKSEKNVEEKIRKRLIQYIKIKKNKAIIEDGKRSRAVYFFSAILKESSSRYSALSISSSSENERVLERVLN